MRSEQQREADMERVAQLYVRGYSQLRIGRALELTREQVRYDIAEIRNRWRESTLVNFSAAQEEELARIEQREATAWTSFEASCKPAEKRIVERDGTAGEPTKTRVEQTTSCGDPRFLVIIEHCSDQRCKILGLYEATKIKVSGPDDGTVKVDINTLSDEQLKLIIAIGRGRVLNIEPPPNSPPD
jgi:hypothetical protein